MSSKKRLNRDYTRQQKKKRQKDDTSYVKVDGVSVPESFFPIFKKKDEDLKGTYEYDDVTNFEHIIWPQRNAVGQDSLFRGDGVIAAEDVPEVLTLLLVSKEAIKLDKKHMYLRKFLSDRGFCLINKNLFNMEESCQKVNARRALSSTRVEDENVVLTVLAGKTIKKRWGYRLNEDCYYAVVYNTKSIKNGDNILVRSYGETSLMQYGKDDYVSAQQECYETFERLLRIHRGTENAVCYRCMELVPRGQHHLDLCIPYMERFFRSTPKKVVISDEDYTALERKYNGKDD